MDRERAEAHLRMLAEDEVRHAVLPDRWGIQVSRGLLTMIARSCGPGEHDPDVVFSFLDFAATDDQGNRYEMGLHGSGVSGPGEWILRLHPDPPPGLRWLDLSTGAGEPAARV